MNIQINTRRIIGKRNPMIYGHFLEHFHRQVYGGIYDPSNPLSDENGLRKDVLEAIKKIKVPVIRWPGGCFVSSYHWKEAVGPNRTPFWDKAWRVEDPATFGTDEFMDFCRKIGCEPYICSNAGTGTSEETSDWVEYCNLASEGKFAKWRIKNGQIEPYNVKYWSIGNENYGSWEIGAKSSDEWGRFVLETAKMIKHVDPSTELSAAALTDLDWNINLLKHCSDFLDWISIHGYWDPLVQENNYADYDGVMAFTNHTADSIEQVEGLLSAMDLKGKIKIAFDEWNTRSWHHPNVFHLPMASDPADYLPQRDLNDLNQTYTIADAIFSACFLNTCNRHCQTVQMANFAPIVNTRGCIYTYDQGIVLRPTYHIFDLYVNYLGDTILDCWYESPSMDVNNKQGAIESVSVFDILATKKNDDMIVLSVVNKDPVNSQLCTLEIDQKNYTEYRIHSLTSPDISSYNDIDRNEISPVHGSWNRYSAKEAIQLPPHSVSIIEIH